MNHPGVRKFDRLAEIYDATRGGEERGRYHARELSQLLRKEDLVLEIGIGTGLVALALSEIGFNVVGIDISRLMLRRAWERIGSRVAVADAAALPVASGSTRQVYAVWVLHHVHDRAAAFREIARVLRPGGLFVTVPASGASPDPITDLVHDMSTRLDAPSAENPDLEGLAAEAALRLVETRLCTPYSFEQSPNEAAAQIEARSQVYLYHVTDEQWAQVVLPTIAALRALPDPDQPIVRSPKKSCALVFERLG